MIRDAMFNELFDHLREEKDFDMESIQRQLWSKLITLEQNVRCIYFDRENDEAHGDPKEVDLEIKYPSGDPVKVVCQLFFAGGDWESPVGYFRCQLQPEDAFFIHIPGPEVNKNLVKRKDGYSPIGNDEKDSEDDSVSLSDTEKELWNDLKRELGVRLKEEVDSNVWEPDYKKMRMFSGMPK